MEGFGVPGISPILLSNPRRYIAGAFFWHFSQLAYSLFGLLQNEISVETVKKIEIVLLRFVDEVEYLYGSHHITYNMHILTHLCKSVIDLGNLWSTSTFIPEWINGDLQKLFNGTQNVVEQMAQTYLTRIAIRNEAVELLASNSVPKEITCLLERLLCLPKSDMSCRVFKNDRVINGCTLRGKAIKRNLIVEEIVALKNIFREINRMSEDDRIHLEDHQEYTFYQKFKLKVGGFFTTCTYGRSPKRIDHFCLLNDNKFFLIENIVVIDNHKSLSGSPIFLFGRKLGTIRSKIYSPHQVDAIVLEKIEGQTTKLIGKGPLDAVPIDWVRKKCVASLIGGDGNSCILTAIPNSWETD